MRQLLVILVILGFVVPGLPCTSAVISGKATPDGRPLLWKHRDTGDLENKLVFIEGSKYDLVGVANTNDTLSQQIWMGVNEVGFAIMNTASYNLNEGQVCDVPDDQEGLFMRAVLEVCANIEEFEAFMDNSQGEWGLAANFGVIDAKGGAAYYEKGYYDYKKYDVTDPDIAPAGYLIRTNFSMSGTEDKGYGFIRHDVTSELFNEQDKISVDFMLGMATRNLKHGLLGHDLRNGPKPMDLNDEQYVLFQDYVVRRYSASTLLIQGVLPEDDPQLTTLWTVLGWQPTTMVTPVWVRSADLLPGLVISENGETTPMNSVSLALKQTCFPIERGNGQDYLLHSQLTNQAGTGILDVILPAEPAIIERTKKLQEKWRKKGLKDRDLKKFNKWLENYIRKTYSEQLNQEIGG
ncbi:MAG: C45 family peptidase [Candidatus Marinimicrobia bacterium]|nr:C45 family peptidase [Candidatus Neomarinimicrobiota bacterium]MCF7904614.1 C45 family peptidase [Candidatus Neomarinimicrobiota bacterium]